MKRNFYLSLFLTIIISGVTSFAVVNHYSKKGGKRTSSQPYSYRESNNSLSLQRASYEEQEYPDFVGAAEEAVKAVVHVKVTKRGSSQPYSLFDFFFGYGMPQEPRVQEGAGSGVIINSNGIIVTNNHVIEGADQIEVTLDNNLKFEAKLLGADPVTDLAVLKIEAIDLPTLPFGDSDALRLGEWVLAIGNPYNLRSTVTAGIVSAKARTMPSPQGEFKIESFIQTDAAVNRGNSGGALINTRGELVGINTAIASRTGDFTGYSFAVPSTIVEKVVTDIVDFGVVQRALMGITMGEVDSELAKERGLEDYRGIYIAEVQRGGAAEKGGVKSGDLLLAINGVAVKSVPAVHEQMSRYRPKERITLQLIRDGKQIEVSVVLDSRDIAANLADGVAEGGFTLFGAALADAPKEKLSKLRLRGGVEVLSVDEGKFKEAGIEAGLIITNINQHPVNNLQQLQRVIQSSQRSILIEGVYPDGKVVFYGVGL